MSAAIADASQLVIKEEDVTRMVIEFLSNRELCISQMSLERETGVHNGSYSDDVLFLRQLILDGQWDDAIMFIRPVEAIENFETSKVRYLIYKHKFLEMLCLQAEASYQDTESAVSELVNCMNALEKYCPSKEEYNELCLLLTLPSLAHDPKYKNWNPSNSRVACFNQVLKLVEKFMPPDGKVSKSAKSDRLMRLLVKGLLYETAVDYCQQQATTNSELKYPPLLDEAGSSSIDLSLLSWLQAIPQETFSYPFKQKALRVEFEKLEKPHLSANWSEMILVAPIKPKVFPHSATPFSRVKGADFQMSKSLTPGLVEGISRHLTAATITDGPPNMSRSSMPASNFNNISMKSNQLLNQQQILQLNKKGLHISLERSYLKGDFESLPTIAERDLLSPLKTPDSIPSSHSNTMSPVVEQIPKYPNHNARRNSPPQGYNQQPQQQQTFATTNARKSNMVDNYGNNVPEEDGAMIKSQDLTMSGLWREFQKQKRILAHLIGDEEKFLSSCHQTPNYPVHSLNYEQANTYTPENREYHSMNQEYATPMNQIGHKNYPEPHKLTTSTPKGQFRRQPTPNQSPIGSTNAHNNQQQAPFDATCSSISSPPHQRNNDFSITYLGRPRGTPAGPSQGQRKLN